MSGKPLKNPRHEAFARHYVQHGVARRAYVAAGYQAKLDDPSGYCPADCGAWRLQRNEKVRGRINALRQAMVKRADITEDNILEKLERVYRRAMENDQLQAANTAAATQAKLVGMMIDRKEIGDAGEFSRMSEQELRDYIASQTKPDDIGTSTVPKPTHAEHKREQ